MDPKEHVDSEGQPQTPEEVDEIPEDDDASAIQNHEQDEDSEGAEVIPMTMDERKLKIQQLRAKMVRRLPSPSHDCLFNSGYSGRLRSRIVLL
jgi:hypothetical protein